MYNSAGYFSPKIPSAYSEIVRRAVAPCSVQVTKHADMNCFQLVYSHFFTGGLLHLCNVLSKLPVGFQSAQSDQGQGLRKELHPSLQCTELPTVCISPAALSRSWWGCWEWSLLKIMS